MCDICRVRGMEVLLEAKDAGDWTYRGEGAANLVLAYKGSSPSFVCPLFCFYYPILPPFL